MLSEQENDRLTRVGPGTPAGRMLRRYWQPVAALAELEREQVLSVKILDERLVLYKSINGEIGLVQERCPHRSASLEYGIPDEEGIRCPYHGWYFNKRGQCLAQPYDDINGSGTYKDKVTIAAYPVQELGGLIWAYFGPEPAPLLPRWDILVHDDLIREVAITRLPCNWLQCMENSLDPVHFEWLHAHLSNYVARRSGQPAAFSPRSHLKIAFDIFEYGIQKRRLLEGDPETSDDWTIGHPILFPNTLAVGLSFQIRVPIDDKNTLHFLYETRRRGPDEAPRASVPIREIPYQHDNGRLIVEAVLNQDFTAWITQGPVAPRNIERLGLSDKGIILYRRLLKENIDKVERGEDPMGLVRDPAKNEPMIAIVREQRHLGSMRLQQKEASRQTLREASKDSETVPVFPR